MTGSADSTFHDVLVIGAGFSGLYALHRCRSRGFSVLGLDKADEVGGTWYWNRYPGARCDVESVDYSYSFDPELEREWRWSERYASQPEILAYLRHVATRHDLYRHLRLGVTVTEMHFDQAASVWRVHTAAGDRHTAWSVVMATGGLSAVNRPDLPGIDDFAGEILYTAQWPHQQPDLSGRRIGVIGTGSSGIQAIPVLAERASALTVFQRTPNFSIPSPNRPLTDADHQRIQREYPERRRKAAYSPAATPTTANPKSALEVDDAERLATFERQWRDGGVRFSKSFSDQLTDPAANDHARRFVEDKIRAIIDDEQTADDLIPDDHPIGTKRICTDSGYYQAFNRGNVELVNLRREPIESVDADGIRTSERHHALDVLVFATGFDALTGALMRIDIRGRGGMRVQDAWGAGPLTYLGLGIPGFPNLYCICGPGAPGVLANMVPHAEQHVDWVADLLTWCSRHRIDQAEPRHDAAAKWGEHLAEIAESTLFPRARSWYVGANVPGKPPVFMPYVGGFGHYRTTCDEIAARGYEGFVMTRMGSTDVGTD